VRPWKPNPWNDDDRAVRKRDPSLLGAALSWESISSVWWMARDSRGERWECLLVDARPESCTPRRHWPSSRAGVRASQPHFADRAWPPRSGLGAGRTSSATLCSKRRRSAAQPAQHLAARSDISYAIEHLRRRILKPRCKPRRHSWQSAFRPRTASCPDSTDLSNPSPTAADSVLYVSGSNNVDQ
jgi:hypothetical protein